MESVHEPVLLHEIVPLLIAARAVKDRKAGTPWYLDGTMGGAGHAAAIAQALNGKLYVIGFDRDPQAVKRAEATLKDRAEKVIVLNRDYRNLDAVLAENCIEGVDMILLDLGISSDELDTSGRGFSFMRDEPLHMTMGTPEQHPFTALDIVNGWDEEDLSNAIFAYGEERFAHRISRAIVAYRAKKRIETSGELAEIVKLSVPPFYRRGRLHPATKTFQALRIAVNDELNALREGLRKGYAALRPGGRMAVISFHSLEDRIVKEFYREQAVQGATLITKKPIVASRQEVAENPRSRSAKLRVIEKN